MSAEQKIITRMEIQKKNKERVNVYLDDEFAFGISLKLALTLKRGQQLSEAEITRLKHEDARTVAYHNATRFLGYRPRSTREIEQYLAKKEFPPDVIEFTVEMLTTRGYLNDEEFARAWVDNRTRFRPRGAYGLRHELRQKGLSDRVIDAAVANLDEETAAWAAVQPKLARWQGLERQAMQQKVISFLNRRGFGYDTARTTFERIWELADNDDTENDEFR